MWKTKSRFPKSKLEWVCCKSHGDWCTGYSNKFPARNLPSWGEHTEGCDLSEFGVIFTQFYLRGMTEPVTPVINDLSELIRKARNGFSSEGRTQWYPRLPKIVLGIWAFLNNIITWLDFNLFDCKAYSMHIFTKCSAQYVLISNFYTPIFKTASTFWKWDMTTYCYPARKSLGCGAASLFFLRNAFNLAPIATYLFTFDMLIFHQTYSLARRVILYWSSSY